MTTDANTPISELKSRVADFVKARGWEKYHSPKNLSMSIALEAAELMEHFQWSSLEESRALAQDDAKMKAVKDELSDIVSYVLSFCNLYGIDLSSALVEKMAKNDQKYPTSKVRNGVLPLV